MNTIRAKRNDIRCNNFVRVITCQHYFCLLSEYKTVLIEISLKVFFKIMRAVQKIICIQKMLSILYIVHLIHEVLEHSNKRKRRWAVREMNRTRDQEGFYQVSYKQFKEKDPEHFFLATRMTIDKFNLLLSLLKERLQRFSRRKPIDPENRLALTLMFLAHGCPPQMLAWTFKLSVCTVRKIIYETCDALWEELHLIYLSPPTQQDWRLIAEGFHRKTGVPNCIGAIDGKHVNIVCPRKSGSLFYNYKQKFSVVLLAICDSAYKFTYIDVGAVGSQSDGGIFSRSSFGRKILTESLDLPDPPRLPNTDHSFPYYFVADSAFPLRRNIMRPYPGKSLDAAKEHFNYKISKARVLIENSFGILANRWRILRTDIYCKPSNADKIILGCVVLHNFLMVHKDEVYFQNENVDHERNGQTVPGQWREEGIGLNPVRGGPNRASAQSFNLRNELCNYFHNIRNENMN